MTIDALFALLNRLFTDWDFRLSHYAPRKRPQVGTARSEVYIPLSKGGEAGILRHSEKLIVKNCEKVIKTVEAQTFFQVSDRLVKTVDSRLAKVFESRTVRHNTVSHSQAVERLTRSQEAQTAMIKETERRVVYDRRFSPEKPQDLKQLKQSTVVEKAQRYDEVTTERVGASLVQVKAASPLSRVLIVHSRTTNSPTLTTNSPTLTTHSQTRTVHSPMLNQYNGSPLPQSHEKLTRRSASAKQSAVGSQALKSVRPPLLPKEKVHLFTVAHTHGFAWGDFRFTQAQPTAVRAGMRKDTAPNRTGLTHGQRIATYCPPPPQLTAPIPMRHEDVLRIAMLAKRLIDEEAAQSVALDFV